MRHSTRCTLALVLGVVVASGWARADDTVPAKPFDPETALEALMSLTGEWVGTTVSSPFGSEEWGEPSPAAISYRVSGNDSAVVATYGAGTQMEMLTIYHLNGPDELMLTHYCALKNQPRMKLEVGKEPGVMKFAFAGGTNFDPKKDRHAHEATLRFIDKDTIETTSIAYNLGKPSTVRKATLKRRK